jgi:hypothetical protein
MSGIIDMLSGIHRYFPNTMITALIVLGLALARVSWVLVGIGGLLLTILIALLQFFFGKFDLTRTQQIPGLVEACSVLPIAGSEYAMLPSYWVAITTYFLSYILNNAVSVYSTNPTRQPNTTIAVQQRKGLGVISIVAICIAALLLLVPRFFANGCESWTGIGVSLVLGGVWGYGWWMILNAQGDDTYQDIHGVMIGLKPGDLRTGAVACVPAIPTH